MFEFSSKVRFKTNLRHHVQVWDSENVQIKFRFIWVQIWDEWLQIRIVCKCHLCWKLKQQNSLLMVFPGNSLGPLIKRQLQRMTERHVCDIVTICTCICIKSKTKYIWLEVPTVSRNAWWEHKAHQINTHFHTLNTYWDIPVPYQLELQPVCANAETNTVFLFFRLCVSL